jgi:XTP/dITP diphosphohydrolase
VNHSLVVATTNHGKVGELRALLAGAGLPFTVHTLDEVLPKGLTIVEDGKTFRDNAVKKATLVAAATMMLTLADDSGLEVDAIDGAPGVHSARYAHDRATDAENNAHLLAALDALEHTGLMERLVEPTYKARFRCVLAIVDPYTHDGEARTAEGVCEGAITRTPRGSGGFGYDPLFLVKGTDKTMAELPPDEKNAVSHRARAVLALRPLLQGVVLDRDTAIARIARV